MFPILSQMPSENPNAYRNKTVNITTGTKSKGYDTSNSKLQAFSLVSTLKSFVNKLIDTYLENFKIVSRIPIRFLSDEDENGKVLVETLLGETDEPFKVLNKSGEIITNGEYGYLEYRKSPTNGWISMRNGKAKPKGIQHYVLITESEWNTLVSNGTVDESMIYIFTDDDEEMY